MINTAKELERESSLRPRGHPKKSGEGISFFDDAVGDDEERK